MLANQLVNLMDNQSIVFMFSSMFMLIFISYEILKMVILEIDIM